VPVRYEFGAPLQQIGIAKNQNGELAGKPKAFRTSGGRAEDFLGQSQPECNPSADV
jgi:hypothetical protein